MSLSSLRRWANRSATPSAEIAPNLSTPAGAEAQFLRGLNFASGQGVAQDYAQAARCYTEAAEQPRLRIAGPWASQPGQKTGQAHGRFHRREPT